MEVKLKILSYLDELKNRTIEHQLAAFAAQMAYFFVLSFFPLLIFILSIISKLNLNYEFMVDAMRRFLPSNISVMITEFIGQTISTEGGAVLSLSGVVMLYSASRAVNALQRAINISYEVVETRNLVIVKFLGMFYTLLFTVIIILSLIIPTIVNDLVDFTTTWLAYEVDGRWLYFFHYLRNILLLSSVVVVIVSIYTFLPNKKMHLRDIYPGALFAIVGSLFTNLIFSKVVIVLTDYSILYGSLSAIIVFMIWINLLAQIIILGAEINAMRVKKRAVPSAKFDNQ